MAFAHHDAAGCDQRSRGEAKLFSTEQSGDRDVATGLQLAVGLNHNAPAQIVHHEHLLGLGQAQLPGNACMFDGGEWRSAGAAIVTADQNHVRMRLGHTRGHRSHADFGDELDGDARLRICVLQVVDQLGQIFDGIDVVMGWRRNEPHARSGVPNLGDELVHLVTGKLAAFARLGALRHLDLQIVGVDEVFGRDAKTG